MIEMHWVIFVLALLVCGVIGWVVRGGCDRRRREAEKENELPENCSGLTLSAAELYYENNLFELHTIFKNNEKEENEYSYLTVEGTSVKVL